MSSSLGWGKRFGEEFAGMYRKKRNKKAVPEMEELVGEAVTRIVSILAESGIDIPKNVLHPPQSPPVSSSEEEDVHGLEEEDVHGSEEEEARDREEDHWHVNEDEGSQQHIDSRSPMLDTIDKLTEPTKCSLLDGSGNKVELALATVFPLQKTLHTVPVQDGYAVVQPSYVWGNTGHYPLPVPIGGDEVTTLAEALCIRIQWSKNRIHVPPITRNTNPAPTSGSRGTASDGGTATQRQQEKAQQQQQISKTTQ